MQSIIQRSKVWIWNYLKVFFCAFFLGKYYPEDEEEDGPSISAIILDHLEHMTKAMSENVTTKTMLDVESKVRRTLCFLWMLDI